MGKHLQISGTPTTGQVPTYDGTEPAWATPASGGSSSAGAVSDIQVGDGAGGFTADATLTYDGQTLKIATVDAEFDLINTYGGGSTIARMLSTYGGVQFSWLNKDNGSIYIGNFDSGSANYIATAHTHAINGPSDLGNILDDGSGNMTIKGTLSVVGNLSAANLSGTNTGDETTATIKTKLSITTLSGSNTGDQTTVSGNAGSATVLQTARLIDGISFNGSADISVIAPATHAATAKTTPVDADETNIADSAASFGLKKVTWANIKATLKTYFDTLYQAVLVSGTNIKTINGSSVLGSGDLTVGGLADPTTTKGDLIAHGTTTTRLPIGSNNQVLTADSAQTLGVKWATPSAGGGAAMPQILGATQNRYYCAGYSNGKAATNSTVAANTMYAMPIMINQNCTLTLMASDVETSVASSNVRLGIYSDTNGLPGSLLLDAGTHTTASVGTKTITGLSQALTPGQYWFVALYSATPGIKSYTTDALIPTLGTGNSISAATPNFAMVTMSQTYGALPSTFSTTPTYVSGPPFPIIAALLT